MEQKHAYVHSWLEKVFSGEEVPPYEVNTHTVDLLYEMANECEQREAQALILLEDTEQKTREYQAEMSRLKAETDWLGVSLTEVSPTAAACVRSLAEAALALDIKDCSDTSLCLALGRLAREHVTDSNLRGELLRRLAAIQDDLKTILLRQVSQRRLLGELSEEMKQTQATMEKQKRETTFLRQKSQQYHKQVSTMKEELREVGYESRFSHAALLEQAKEVGEIQGQLAPLKAQLASYRDLPPDIDLAKVKVEEARRHLVRLEAELSRKIDLVHVEK